MFPHARLLVRLDGGFAGPRILGFLSGQPRVDFVVGLPQNAALLRQIEPLMVQAIGLSHRENQPVTLFGEFQYAAATWQGFQHRVVAKAEVVHNFQGEPRNNPRFVVTNLRHRPDRVYAIYRRRGEIENRIKEAHDGLKIDRTSCHRFAANQFRLLLTALAYVLMQELRRVAARKKGPSHPSQRPQIGTLRLMLLNMGGWVERSTRRVILHLTENHGWITDWLRVAARCGAT